jgi:hypothetical protein
MPNGTPLPPVPAGMTAIGQPLTCDSSKAAMACTGGLPHQVFTIATTS